MKAFKDLQFEQHPNRPYFRKQAKLQFDNGFGVSVITGEHAYSNETNPYELAVLDVDGSLCYSTEITDDVIGYLNEDQVTAYMIKVQEL